MPKDRRSSSCRCRASPYSCDYKNADKRRPKSPSRVIGNEKEYEEARCPICMEHPHNAVLLHCSSHEKGCRSYMCDTSSRHSNCLDQFRKSTKAQLFCPLCRGQISRWTVVKAARQFMNSKTRNCSLGTCDFAGNYSQLREHARRVHPRVKPTDVDPERELQWRNLEDDMEQQDMLNMQFEFDDADYDATELLVEASISSPLWDYGYASFDSIFDSDYENVFSELDSALDDTSLLSDDIWDDMFEFLALHESEIRDTGTSRGTRNRSLERSRENARATSSRTTTHVRQRSNSQRSSRNRRGR